MPQTAVQWKAWAAALLAMSLAFGGQRAAAAPEGPAAPVARESNRGGRTNGAAAASRTGRGFLMSFTSWPYAATPEAVRDTYAFIGANADMLTEHFDEGTPWTAALADAPFPRWFVEKMEGRKRNRPANTKLVLALTPLNMGRDGLANSLGEKGAQPPPAELRGRTFNDPALTRAHLNYCRWMVQFFQPNYLLTGIEANELWKTFPAEVKDLGGLWRDTGLLDEQGHPRPAYRTWTNYFSKANRPP